MNRIGRCANIWNIFTANQIKHICIQADCCRFGIFIIEPSTMTTCTSNIACHIHTDAHVLGLPVHDEESNDGVYTNSHFCNASLNNGTTKILLNGAGAPKTCIERYRPNIIVKHSSSAMLPLFMNDRVADVNVPFTSSYVARGIHTSTQNCSDSLGADSSGMESSTNDVKELFDKWKASIDFDLLSETHKRLHEVHMKAVEEQKDLYLDPTTGFDVVTIMAHLQRGNCCGHICRHCPYNHVNAPKQYRDLMRNNTAFYH